MLESFVNKNRNLVKYIIIGLISAILLFGFISLIGSYSNNGGFNAALTFNFIAYAGLLGVLLFCIIANKEDLAKLLGVLYIAYYVISDLLSFGNPFTAFYNGNHGTFVAAAVFEILANVCLVAILVFGIIEYLNGKTFGLVVEILVFAFVGFCILLFIMEMAAFAVAKYVWPRFIDATANCLLAPCLLVFGYLYLHTKESAPNDEVMDDMGPQNN